MKKIIIALGNYGERYKNTRHNAGWIWSDSIFGAEDYKKNKYGNYSYLVKNNFYIIKPLTLMNNSGLIVKDVLDFFKFTIKDLIVVHDDSDLQIGEYKYVFARGSAGHNGVQSIINELKTNEFYRLRIGIRPKSISATIPASEYVLENFSKNEKKIITSIPIEVIKN